MRRHYQSAASAASGLQILDNRIGLVTQKTHSLNKNTPSNFKMSLLKNEFSPKGAAPVALGLTQPAQKTQKTTRTTDTCRKPSLQTCKDLQDGTFLKPQAKNLDTVTTTKEQSSKGLHTPLPKSIESIESFGDTQKPP